MPSQPDIRPSTTVFFARSLPPVSRAICSIGTGITSAGVTPTSGILSGATFVLLS